MCKSTTILPIMININNNINCNEKNAYKSISKQIHGKKLAKSLVNMREK